MKNIILLGVPRSGKTTFAQMILAKYPNYNLIQGDAISVAFNEYDQEINKKEKEGITVYTYKDNSEIVSKLILNSFKCSVEFNPKLNFILDSVFLDINDLVEYVNQGVMVIVFGYPNRTYDECIKDAMGNEIYDDWVFDGSRFTIENVINLALYESKKYKDECKKLNLKFVDTSRNREKVLEDLFKWFEEENE